MLFLIYVALGLGFVPCARANVFLNGHFAQGAGGWETVGEIDFRNGFADFSDGNDSLLARLFQFVAFSGEGTLSFEFSPNLSSAVPPGRSPDTVFASLYVTDDPATFDLDGGTFDNARALFQADRNGVQIFNGSLSEGTLGPGWLTYTVDLLSTNQFVVPVLELIGANEVDDDSRLLVDNFRMVVDRSLLFPRLTSFRIVPSEGLVEFTFEDPKGREDAFTVEETTGLQDEESWAPIGGVTVECTAPGQFRGSFFAPGGVVPELRFYRVYPK